MILSLDPGPHCGVAYKGVEGTYTTTVLMKQEEVYDLVRLKPSNVVIEKFSAVTISRFGLYTVELVGGVKALCYLLKIPIHIHPPQGRYAFMADSKRILKEQGGPHMPHEIDALAHLLAFEHWGR